MYAHTAAGTMGRLALWAYSGQTAVDTKTVSSSAKGLLVIDGGTYTF